MDQPTTPLKPRILVAALDWGLGHATRCIPLIRELVRQNCEVHLAGEGATRLLLQHEFPQLSFHDLKGYGVSYSRNKWTLPFVMATQIPKIVSAIKYENRRLRQLVESLKIDGIISDNRYGLYHPTVPSVFITHQLLIKTHLGNTADRILQRLNYRYISRFSECWVPDYENSPNLAGELSHPAKEPGIPVRYLGPLSRMVKNGNMHGKGMLILLSGPEPQRTILEKDLLAQLPDYPGEVVLVRGLPQKGKTLEVPPNVNVHDHLPAHQLNRQMMEAEIIISRSGYSTVMDIAALEKKSIMIPTPGQTEQEYLAAHLMQMSIALGISQSKFKLSSALSLARSFHYDFRFILPESHLESAVKSFLYKIQFKVFGSR